MDMDNTAAFVVNRAGATHSVPGSWVMPDNKSAFPGAVTVRGNEGFRLASEDEIERWHDAQGLDTDTREDDEPDDDEAVPQPANFTVSDGDDVKDASDPIDKLKASAKK